MNVRNEDTYKIMFANTERLKKSSVIYLQNLLNNEQKKTKQKKK